MNDRSKRGGAAQARWLAASWLALAIATPLAQAADEDALSLEAPETPATPAPSSKTGTPAADTSSKTLRLYVEGTVGRLWRRGGLADADSRRVSIDYSQSFRLAPGWRAVLSDRFDDVHPAGEGERSSANSLREAYVGWQAEDGGQLLEFGRINLRLGPAYGFNPTDYFRDGALRAVTTADPLALREIRLGAVMLRGQHLWQGGGVMVAIAPKLADAPSDAPMSLDLGATNRRLRGLAAVSGKLGERVNWQLLGYGEQARSPQWGANLTALLSDAAVAHAEWSRGREPDRLASALGQPSVERQRQRWSAGLTYTTSTRLAITAEYAYNGAAPDRAAWDAVGAAGGASALGAYLLDAQNRQDSSSRTAWLVYATQKSLGLKNLDLTGFVRFNAEDRSRFTWVEIRYHWDRFDAAVQWFGASGSSLSEYGVIPNRQSLQVLGTWFF